MVIIIKRIILYLLIIFIIISFRIIYINNKSTYKIKLKRLNNKYTYSLSAPRGRILDIKGKVIVDNIKKRVIIYNKLDNPNINNELIIAKKLSKYLTDDFNITKKEISNYIFNKENNLKKYISEDDYKKYKNSIINYQEARNIALNNIKNNYNNSLSLEELKIAKIYNLMNKDYYYDKKIIYQDLDDKTYFKIMDENIPGISGEYIYERYYPYGDVLKSILGKVGKIDRENKEEFLSKGYMISDLVGLSYLEKEYEDILKGSKGKYKLNKDGTYTKVLDEKIGNDIYLNIDMDIEEKLYEIMKKHIYETKGKFNTEFYNKTYVLVGTPDGKIKAVLGLRINNDNSFTDITNDIITSSFVVGSVVKAASNTVAYHENVIVPGKKINDSCVKLYLNTIKCSFSRLGYIDDISALEKSSNYYQFINAIKVMGYNYKYNMKINATSEDFDKYRNIFKEYGLGSKTNIDLPNEKEGIKGNIVAPDLLLNLSIGQYDAYTPVQLLSYANTLASNGKRYNLSLLSNDNNIIDTVEISDDNMKRIHEGLHKVVTSGTGKGYIYNNDGAGKTGTSETLYDKDNDGIYETNSTSTAFIGFAPYIKPKYTFAIISPNISSNIKKGIYKVPINRYIMRDLTNFLFEK